MILVGAMYIFMWAFIAKAALYAHSVAVKQEEDKKQYEACNKKKPHKDNCDCKESPELTAWKEYEYRGKAVVNENRPTTAIASWVQANIGWIQEALCMPEFFFPNEKIEGIRKEDLRDWLITIPKVASCEISAEGIGGTTKSK